VAGLSGRSASRGRKSKLACRTLFRAPRTMTIFSPDQSPVQRDGDFRFNLS
jgi:hypothetical protein